MVIKKGEDDLSVAVIGGGITGLTIAYRLASQGLKVTLFEKDDVLGGLASSIDVGPIKVEKYYHFICMRDIPYFDMLDELGLGDKLNWTETRMSYYAHGNMYDFSTPFDLLRFKPIGFLNRFRFGLNILYTSRIKNWQRLDGVKSKEWLLKHIGKNAYEEIWEPLMKMKFGDRADDISAAWLWGRAKRVAQSRVKGMQRERLGFVEGGTQTLIDRMEQKIIDFGGEIRLNSGVSGIATQEGEKTRVEVNGEQLQFDQVVSTLPVPLFLRLSTSLPEGLEHRLSEVEYYAVACMFLRLKQHLTDNFWLNAHDSRITFAGIIEYSNLNPLPKLEGSSIAYVPYYLPADSDFYNMTTEKHREHLIKELVLINPEFDESWIQDLIVVKDEFAQPICSVNHLDRVPPFRTGVPGLYMAEMSQIYPEDRGVSNAIDIGNKVSSLMIEDSKEMNRDKG